LRLREIDVFEKISNFLGGEEDRIKKDADSWMEKLEGNRDKMEKNIEQIQNDTRKSKERYEKIKGEFEREAHLQASEESRIKEIMLGKHDEKEKQRKIDDAMMLIQREFEIW